MKARTVPVFTAWLLTLCIALPSVGQSNPQSPSTTSQPQGASSDPTQNPAQAPAAQPSDTSPSDVSDDSSTNAAQSAPNVHRGGKDDVDAIGNRNVGKRGLGDWYS